MHLAIFSQNPGDEDDYAIENVKVTNLEPGTEDDLEKMGISTLKQATTNQLNFWILHMINYAIVVDNNLIVIALKSKRITYFKAPNI